jgi:two-component system response regulator DegU
MKVMVVDDNARIRRMIRMVLENFVEEFVECADGSEAVSTYERHHPDWVLMDIEMEHVDGITATRQIMDAHPDARIIIVTNYLDDSLQESARHAGAKEYVLKENISRVLELIEA